MATPSDLMLRSLDQLPDSVMVTEPVIPAPRILYVNDAFSAMTGYPREEVLGLTPRILQGPATDRRVLDRLREDLLAGRPFVGEAVNYRRDGTTFWLRWHISPVAGPANERIAYVSVQRDVTPEHEGQTEQIEQLSKLRAHLAYAERLVHDLDNAVSAIALNAMLALDVLAPTHPSREFVRSVSHAVVEAREIARELASDTTSGELETAVNRVAAQLVSEMRQLAPAAVDMTLEADPADPHARFPSVALRRILRNLIANALEAMDGASGRIAIRIRSTPSDVVVEVHDTGPGIPPEHRERIWTQGFSTKGPGRGRGLAAVVALLAEHGGSIDLASSGEASTAFHLHLPRG